VIRLALIAVLASACGGKCPACPTLPVRPVSEPVKVITIDPPRCVLPDLPEPFKMVGYPSPDGQQIYMSKTDVAQLAVYLAALRNWVQ
jgi:hypothetical protein